MTQKTITAEQAAELVYNLFAAQKWLLEPGAMTEADRAYEEEALTALLSLDEATRWQNVSPPAARVASTMLIQFLALLAFPKDKAWAERKFTVDSENSSTQQAFALIAAEILQNHPHLNKTQ